MFFGKKERDGNIDEIKDMMLEEEEEKEEIPEREEVPTTRSEGAPLFVKVDKYKELISTIHELKLFLSSTKQLFALVNEIESVRGDAYNVLRATIQRLERSVTEMDTGLLRPRGIDTSYDRESSDVDHIESSLSDLHKQLMDLKREFSSLNNAQP
jgi:predicted RNase H-like nuclease (RuvC/YqgF family)